MYERRLQYPRRKHYAKKKFFVINAKSALACFIVGFATRH